MIRVLAPILWKCVLVYIDDVIGFSYSFDDHLKHLDMILSLIEKAGITLSPSKCHIAYQSLVVLGQQVSRLGMSTHKEKVEAVDAMKEPTGVNSLQAFLGFINYFANYVSF